MQETIDRKREKGRRREKKKKSRKGEKERARASDGQEWIEQKQKVEEHWKWDSNEIQWPSLFFVVHLRHTAQQENRICKCCLCAQVASPIIWNNNQRSNRQSDRRTHKWRHRIYETKIKIKSRQERQRHEERRRESKKICSKIFEKWVMWYGCSQELWQPFIDVIVFCSRLVFL